ncbi:hypothetical protein BDN70DRAFT_559850 [Pholiota conissans]|uniref:Uncharacterized protein n=1 Tax=Pholiota conissans TaxID=109636 RepID=A0A9P5Z4C2_9AGAR|nr:hypothetical protein BDN70DRAFT_559850 [Pholiota conissans]
MSLTPFLISMFFFLFCSLNNVLVSCFAILRSATFFDFPRPILVLLLLFMVTFARRSWCLMVLKVLVLSMLRLFLPASSASVKLSSSPEIRWLAAVHWMIVYSLSPFDLSCEFLDLGFAIVIQSYWPVDAFPSSDLCSLSWFITPFLTAYLPTSCLILFASVFSSTHFVKRQPGTKGTWYVHENPWTMVSAHPSCSHFSIYLFYLFYPVCTFTQSG